MTARSQANILIIDDDREFCHLLERMVEGMGHQATCAHSLAEAMGVLDRLNIDLVFLDVRLPDANGLEKVPQLKATASAPEVIVMTGHQGIKGAEAAIRAGAWDYLEKPFPMAALEVSLRRAFNYRLQNIPATRSGILERDGLLGASPPMTTLLEDLRQASRSQGPVLLHGEKGTGKKLAAQVIHANSLRSGGPLVQVRAGQIQDSKRQGPFLSPQTSSGQDEPGLWAEAQGGSLLLERVEELPAQVQDELCGLMRPGPPQGRAGVRVLATSLLEPASLGGEGGVTVELARVLTDQAILLPPLRQREGDVEELARHFVRGICARLGLREKKLAPSLLGALVAYSWPGNVRELRLVLKGAVAAAEDEPDLDWAHLPLDLRLKLAAGWSLAQAAGQPETPLPTFQEFSETQQSAAEREYLARLLDLTDGNLDQVGEMAGLDTGEVGRLLDKHGLKTGPA